jgi:hypothetical protein
MHASGVASDINPEKDIYVKNALNNQYQFNDKEYMYMLCGLGTALIISG